MSLEMSDLENEFIYTWDNLTWAIRSIMTHHFSSKTTRWIWVGNDK